MRPEQRTRERLYNLERLEIVRDMLETGQIKDREKFWKNNDLWPSNTEGYCVGWVACFGVECKSKLLSTKHECPLEPTNDGCWWIKKRTERLDADKKRKAQPRRI